jgi:hypothetical protein
MKLISFVCYFLLAILSRPVGKDIPSCDTDDSDCAKAIASPYYIVDFERDRILDKLQHELYKIEQHIPSVDLELKSSNDIQPLLPKVFLDNFEKWSLCATQYRDLLNGIELKFMGNRMIGISEETDDFSEVDQSEHASEDDESESELPSPLFKYNLALEARDGNYFLENDSFLQHIVNGKLPRNYKAISQRMDVLSQNVEAFMHQYLGLYWDTNYRYNLGMVALERRL